MKRSLALGALLLVLTALVYRGVAGHPFVRLDDFTYITGNPNVRAGLTMEGARWAATTFHEANWHPLTWLSHMLDVTLFGMDAGRHHLVNLLLHQANTLLLFLLLARLTGAPWRSFLVAALFGVHPLHVESVAWAAERKDLLSAFFWFLTLLAYAGYARRGGAARYLAVVAAFACSLLAKPMAVTLPFALLLVDFWPLRRLVPAWGAAGAASARGVPFPRLVVEKLPLLALALASSAMTFAAQAGGASVVPLAVIPAGIRAANALTAYTTYLGKTFLPVSLAVFYPHPWYLGGIAPVKTAAAALLLGAISLLALRQLRERPYLATGWFLFLGMLVPVIGLVQVGGQALADRYTYLPLIGIFVALSWGTAELAAARRSRPLLTPALWCAALVILTVLARGQVAYWRSDEALYAHALDVAPSWLIHTNFGEVREAQGNLADAASHYRAALRLAPGDTIARHHLADLLVREGRYDEAAAELAAALQAKPGDGIARYKLGSIRFRQGRVEEAIASFQAALERLPDDAEVRDNLGFALLTAGRTGEAVVQFREALRLSPGDPVALGHLGDALRRAGAGGSAAPPPR